MDAIERDVKTYGGLVATARARAEGIRKLSHDKAHRETLANRGVDEADAKHLDAAADAIEADVEAMRQLWAELQQLAAHLHEESAALRDDIRALDDAARAAFGRKSEHLPVLGIRPAIRHVPRARATAPSSGAGGVPASSAADGAAS
jgi:uncharacterized protein (DUF885 family)